MDKELYLAFIDNVGTNLDEKYVYHFYFSETPEIVWGEFWNVCPCSIVPTIVPDKATISSIYECEFNTELSLVTNNSCFSMQDCIDQIIALGWFEINDNVLFNDKTLFFSFGEHFENVENKITSANGEMVKIWEQTDDSDDMIENLIDRMGGRDDEW